MHVEKTSYAMACAMEVIESFCPQVLSRKRIDLKSCRAFRENSPIDSDMALQDESVCTRFFRGGCSERDGTSGISGAVPKISMSPLEREGYLN